MLIKSRIGVIVCSITATVYYGGLCTQKYISDPVTVITEIVPLESLPPLRWSICKPVRITDCKVPDFFNLNYVDYYHDKEEYDNTTTKKSPLVGK